MFSVGCLELGYVLWEVVSVLLRNQINELELLALQDSTPVNSIIVCPLSFCCWVVRRRRLSLSTFSFSGAGETQAL